MEPEPDEEDSGPSTAARIRPAPETRPASHPLGGGGEGVGGDAPPDTDGRGGGSPPAADDSMGGRRVRTEEQEDGRRSGGKK
uniref:Uncharacterized protein n=1 Tax=Arundo donax TaxID=35708 RepID=A0A0A9BQI9_ARUDO